MELHIMRPEWLWLLVPAAVLALLLWRQRGRSGSWSDVIAPELLPHLIGESAGERRFNFIPLLLLAWILATLAAAGPSWQKLPQPIHQKQDALVLVLDLSYSMKSADLAPSRLDRARQKLLDLLEQRKEGQTGLIAYAGDSHIVTPLTDDTPTIANLLPALHPDMMPVPGSDPVAAVSQAIELLHSAGIRKGRILLLSDGVAEKQLPALRKALGGSGATLSVLGIGTSTGAPIPLPRGGFLKDKSGTIVMPTLDPAPLQQLASAGGGSYTTMTIDDSDLERLLAESLLPDAEQTRKLERTADVWDDQGYWLVLVLLPLVLGLFRRGWIAATLPLLFLTQPQPAQAFSWDDLWLTPDQQGQRAYQEGRHEEAASLFENRDWSGTSAYEAGDYPTAAEAFENNDSADGWYNRGNALARGGQLDEAIEAYRESLTLEPERNDAEENLALLEQLKEQQEQQQQQQQQNGEGEQQEQSSDQNQQSEDQQQSEQQQNQGGENSDQQSSSEQEGQPGQQEQDQEQQPGASDRESGQQDSEQQNREDGEENSEQQKAATPDEGEQSGEEQQASAAEAEPVQADPEQQEKDQAMEQWLRRVPDDPSGLLREKFRYESRKRQEQGQGKSDDIYW